MIGVLVRRRRGYIEIHTEAAQVKTVAEFGVRQLYALECQGMPGLKGKNHQ